MKKAIAFSSVIAGAIFLSGCGYQQTNQSNVPASTAVPSEAGNVQASPNSVAIRNFAFTPANLTVKAGTTVTWTNNDSVTHSIKSSSFASSADLSSGQTYQFQFNTPGTFSYSCGIHPSMAGTITVQ